ncbi:hypothetical protein J6590_041275 [Homalodisca vitripennis]|nr:hypothetical protein J6590_041275 [Homalodisca vitripennis]
MYDALSILKRGDNTRQMRAFVRVRTSVAWDSPQCRPPAPGLNPLPLSGYLVHLGGAQMTEYPKALQRWRMALDDGAIRLRNTVISRHLHLPF